MPHSACNCRCVMCDIWKDNKNLKQLTEEDISGLIYSLKKFGTKQVLMSGGEALLNQNFFGLCEILKKENISISLLSTGLTLHKNIENILRYISEVIISLDGNENTHNTIRNIPDAFSKLKEGIKQLKNTSPYFRITGRTVIHRLNFRVWPEIIDTEKELKLDQISFLPADVSSTAFNRETPWDVSRQQDVMLSKDELPELKNILDDILKNNTTEFETHFIAESPEKLSKIYNYYTALYGLNPFPYKKCNAPWVSTVIEADGTVRPCFFHPAYGNIKENTLNNIINSSEALEFRKNLDIDTNPTCVKCVCYLNLPPRMNPAEI